MTMLQIDGVLRIVLKNIPKAAAGAEYEGSPPCACGLLVIGHPLLGVPRIPIERVVLNAGRPAVRTPCRYKVLR